MWDTGKGFYIIYDCGLAVEPYLGRKRRLDTRLPPLSFYGLNECCFFAAYISACPLVYIYVTVKTRIEDIFPEIAPLVCLINGLLKPVGPKGKFTPDVYIRCSCPNGVTCYDHPLKKLMWVLFYDNPVLECAWFSLVSVTA